MQAYGGSIAPVIRHYPRGHHVPWHEHPWPQLVYASSGVLGVETSQGSWIVPPQRAVWLPPNCLHDTRMLTDVELSSLYLENTPGWSADCQVIEVSPLLRELILSAMQLEGTGELSERGRLVIRLIGYELQSAPKVGSPIPMPRDARLQALCRKAILNPRVEISFEQYAADAGLTPKTASRLFLRDLGIGFREWRRLAHVSIALAQLAQGEPIKSVASMLGYTPSAFAAMIRRSTGHRPNALRAAEGR